MGPAAADHLYPATLISVRQYRHATLNSSTEMRLSHSAAATVKAGANTAFDVAGSMSS